ncbi:hypothetical protein APF79_07045 [bacterium BRH_c32]|nr:MAG: hypothetical protein APF79_07045 [bacterium BRH_c32]
MKTTTQKYLKKIGIVIGSIIIVMLIFDLILLPLYVSGTELNVPNVVGMQKDKAIELLEDLDLVPIIQTARFDDKMKKDYVLFQKPLSKSLVKEGRRIYLTISGGDPKLEMPSLMNKSIRDAKITIERAGLKLGSIDSVDSELPIYTVVGQSITEGTDVSKGTLVNIRVSIGPQIGMIRVPNILGRSLSEAESILQVNSLFIGKISYIYSPTLLPNTIVDQVPAESNLIPIGDSISVVLTQSKLIDN